MWATVACWSNRGSYRKWNRTVSRVRPHFYGRKKAYGFNRNWCIHWIHLFFIWTWCFATFPWIIKGISCIFIFFGAHLFFYYLWLYAIFNLYVDFYRFIVHRGFYVLGLVFIEVHSMEIRVWTCHKDELVKYCDWYWYMPWHCSGLSNCIGGV